MQGDTEIIKHLNQILGNELIAINQYFLHSRMLMNWGFQRLADLEYKESLDEMKHADMLAQRILLLEGLPNFQDLGRLRIGENIPEILRSDLELEMQSHKCLIEAVASCERKGDFVSRDLCSRILESEEEHIDWLETQINLLEKLGEQNYLQSQTG